MCQVYGPAIMVACDKCGASVDQDWIHTHKCKKFVPFEQWDAELQARAKEPLPKDPFWRTLKQATRSVASWPKWKRHYVWANEFQHSVKD